MYIVRTPISKKSGITNSKAKRNMPPPGTPPPSKKNKKTKTKPSLLAIAENFM